VAQSPPLPQPDVTCAVLHRDEQGNTVPCPGHDQPTQPDPLAEARQLLAEHEQARMRACAAEIEKVLARYGMRLDITPAQIVLTPAT
jgi:hypothetical protein